MSNLLTPVIASFSEEQTSALSFARRVYDFALTPGVQPNLQHEIQFAKQAWHIVQAGQTYPDLLTDEHSPLVMTLLRCVLPCMHTGVAWPWDNIRHLARSLSVPETSAPIPLPPSATAALQPNQERTLLSRHRKTRDTKGKGKQKDICPPAERNTTTVQNVPAESAIQKPSTKRPRVDSVINEPGPSTQTVPKANVTSGQTTRPSSPNPRIIKKRKSSAYIVEHNIILPSCPASPAPPLADHDLIHQLCADIDKQDIIINKQAALIKKMQLEIQQMRQEYTSMQQRLQYHDGLQASNKILEVKTQTTTAASQQLKQYRTDSRKLVDLVCQVIRHIKPQQESPARAAAEELMLEAQYQGLFEPHIALSADSEDDDIEYSDEKGTSQGSDIQDDSEIDDPADEIDESATNVTQSDSNSLDSSDTEESQTQLEENDTASK